MKQKFKCYFLFTLKNLNAGAVYDIIAKAKNKYGWSQLSKVFNFFNKGVGKYHSLFSDLPWNVLIIRVTFNMENHKPTTSYQNFSIF